MIPSILLELQFSHKKAKSEDLKLFYTEIANSNSQLLKLSQELVTEDSELSSKQIDHPPLKPDQYLIKFKNLIFY